MIAGVAYTPARRPAYTVLDTAKILAATDWRPPHWRDALGAYLREKGHAPAR